MATNGHAAPSRDDPNSTLQLEAGRTLQLGEFAQDRTLNLSEARIILQKSLEKRHQQLAEQNPNVPLAQLVPRENEILGKTRIYLELFSTFKEMGDAEQAEREINSFADSGMQLEMFERSQLGSLVPSCADEAKALIPSLEKKVEDGLVGEDELDSLCRELGRIKKQTQL